MVMVPLPTHRQHVLALLLTVFLGASPFFVNGGVPFISRSPPGPSNIQRNHDVMNRICRGGNSNDGGSNGSVLNPTNVTGGFTSSSLTNSYALSGSGLRRGGSSPSPSAMMSSSSSSSAVDTSTPTTNTEKRPIRMSRMRSRLAASLSDNEKQQAVGESTPEIESSSSDTPRVSSGPPLKVLFLSADTGGGHRASAESLAKQFVQHYPGTTYDLLDVWTEDGCWPYRVLVPVYKYLSANPRQWGLLYHASNTSPYLLYTDTHSMITCERKIRRRIAQYNPDVIVSVHPTMQHVPLRASKNYAKSLNPSKHIPFFTVVTDFGSGHCHWFNKGVDKMYVASDRIRKLARRRGRVPEENLLQIGLPIRMDFAVQAKAMGGDRTSDEGKRYITEVRNQLGIDSTKKMVLVMGGGEGVGSLAEIVDSLYVNFAKEGIDATIAVVCGRNEKVLKELKMKDWDKLIDASLDLRYKKRYYLYRFLGRAMPSRRIRESLKKYRRAAINAANADAKSKPRGNVEVLGLGFVTNMAEYMAATDVLVTKAGPGTIAEAAAVGLPVMLTSYLPGQEAGNVDVVLDGGFGDYCSDPDGIAEEVGCWLQDEPLLEIMSKAATVVGAPDAASDIVLDMGKITHEVMLENNKSSLE